MEKLKVKGYCSCCKRTNASKRHVTDEYCIMCNDMEISLLRKYNKMEKRKEHVPKYPKGEIYKKLRMAREQSKDLSYDINNLEKHMDKLRIVKRIIINRYRVSQKYIEQLQNQLNEHNT